MKGIVLWSLPALEGSSSLYGCACAAEHEEAKAIRSSPPGKMNNTPVSLK